MGLCRFRVALQDRAAEFMAHRVRFYSRSVGVLIDRLGRAPRRESIVPRMAKLLNSRDHCVA